MITILMNFEVSTSEVVILLVVLKELNNSHKLVKHLILVMFGFMW